MGDEQGACGTEGRTRDEGRSPLDHGAHEGLEGLVGDAEGEEGGYGGRHGDAFLREPLQTFLAWRPTSGDDHMVVVGELVERVDLPSCLYRDTMAARLC